MQSLKSGSSSSEMHPKNSPSPSISKRTPSPKITRSSSVSSADSRTSRISERKPSPRPQSSHEKQRPVRISEVQQQWSQLQEDVKNARKELAELEKTTTKNRVSTSNDDRIKMLESEFEKSKESEGKMLESLFSQLHEDLKNARKELAELEKKNRASAENDDRIKILESELEKSKESEAKMLESLFSQIKILVEEGKLEKKGSSTYIYGHEEIENLRTELRLAQGAEERSKKAMDDFAIALKEISSELSVTKLELANEKASKSLLSEQKLQTVLEDYQKLKLRYEDSAIDWKEQEAKFINCIQNLEEEMKKKDEETSKLKKSLEIAHYEKYELNRQLLKRDEALQQSMKDYDNLRAINESFRKSKALKDDRMIGKSAKRHPSDRRKNGHDGRLPSTLFSDCGRSKSVGFDRLNGTLFSDIDDDDDDDDKERRKKKKTALQRIMDVLWMKRLN